MNPINLSEAKAKALSLMAEYSVDGVVTPDGDNADYLIRMNRFADQSQKQIARYKKIHASFAISQQPIPNQLGLLKGFDILLYRPGNEIIYEYRGTKAFYFEVDNIATIYVEENVNGVWTVLQTINNTVKRQYTAHKGLVIASDPNNYIRIRFSGDYPYSYRNIAMYEYNFPTSDDVPDYLPYVKYQVPTDFMELQKVMQSYETRQYRELIDYYWEGKRTFVVNYYYNGQFDILYYRYPTTITQDTPDTYEFEVDTEAQELIPFYIASKCIYDENPVLGTQLLNEYTTQLQGMFTQDDYGITTISNHYVM